LKKKFRHMQKIFMHAGLPDSIAAHKIRLRREPSGFPDVMAAGRMERKMADSEDWIKSRAYELWEQEGQPHGKDAEHWEQARREYEQRSTAPASNGAKPPATRRKAAVKPEPAPTDPAIDTAAAAKPKAKTATKAAAKPATTAKKRTVKPSAS
jgi:Protein of unknown function (DUF2934)